MVKKLVCVVAVIGLGLAGSVASGDITGGLVGHWPLDGNATDVSGNGLDGEILGNVLSAENRLGYEESAMLFPVHEIRTLNSEIPLSFRFPGP